MSTYTKSPWEIEWCECKTGGEVHWRVPKSIGPISPDHGHWSGPYIDVEEADAHLIAAAPDLLEAIEAVNQHLCYGISGTIDALKDISSAAIAKAKGEV